MLKVTYTESGLHLECLKESLEDWITVRVLLALRTGHRLMLEASTASILLPVRSLDDAALEVAILQEDSGVMSLSICDADHMEVCISGTWVTSNSEEEGIFMAQLHAPTEQILFQLWQTAHRQISPLRR
ncbi:alr0857 family protein [Egbenema bharatensis]|uniref:alr0857 family protein n=1 Tax=Egbenema bharatensis TaxID=3463334 RepID=UPI003A84D474